MNIKPTMLFLFLLLFTNYSCNNEELFIEQSQVPEDEIILEEEEEITPDDEDAFDAIILKDDSYNTNQEESIVLTPFQNDENIPTSFILSFTNPINGTLFFNDNETPDNLLDDIINYIPNPGFSGIDNFEYTICNSVNQENCSTALIDIIVNPVFSDDIATELKAFPTAYGAGANATGGRGGKVVHVTTLNWSGPGSLKEALLLTEPRIIVFDVSGEIDATSQSDYSAILKGSSYSNLTIAGQTAPNGGITIRTSEFIFKEVNNVIIRYIRFRNKGLQQDAQWFINCNDIIFDHCTFSHGGDEAASTSSSSGAATNYTYQRCFFQDSKTGSIMGVDGGAGNYSCINNVFSNISHRFPNTKGVGRYDIINNVVYNWKARLSRFQEGGQQNLINNYYKASASGLRKSGWYGASSTRKVQHKVAVNNNDITPVKDFPVIYASGSIITGEREIPQVDDRDTFTAFYGSTSVSENDPVPSKYFTSTPYVLNGVGFTIKTALETYTDVLNDVGANKTLNADGSINYYQDRKDTDDILMIKNDTYSGDFYESRRDIPYPVIPESKRGEGYDSDRDGMPDVWERAMFGDLSKDGKGDTDGDGYTDIEEFLNRIDL